MPRLPQTERDKIKSSVADQLDLYCAQRRRANADCDTIAHALGMSHPTLWKKRKDPGGLTLDQLMNIANTLNISLQALLGVKERE